MNSALSTHDNICKFKKFLKKHIKSRDDSKTSQTSTSGCL